MVGCRCRIFDFGVVGSSGNIPLIGAVLVMGALTLGEITFFFGLIHKNDDANLKSIFAGFNNFVTSTLVYILTTIYTILWTFLFIIPGIVKSFSYSASLYLLKVMPEKSTKEIIAASRDLMKGNKWRYFCLNFSFLGWQILSVLTLGILYIYVLPYIKMAQAEFFEELIAIQNPVADIIIDTEKAEKEDIVF